MSITVIIIIITAIVSIMAFNNSSMMYRMQFNPYSVSHRNEYERFLTHGLLHADWIHLLVNMFVLWMFGRIVEQYFHAFFGDKAILFFVLMYIGGIVISVIPTYMKHKDHHWYNGVGASGAVSAVLFSYILFQPLQMLYLYGIIPIPGILAGVLYIGYSYYMGKKGNDNVNHDAHLFGALFGIAFTLILNPAIGKHFIERLTAVL